MNNQNKKVVWILGTGFSQPLGGPMLNDLLAYREPEVVREQTGILNEDLSPEERRGREEILQAMDCARELFNYGLKHGLWTNAEEFLDTLESAHLGSDSQERSAGRIQIESVLRSLFPTRDLYSLAKGARHAVAFDCIAFLRAADVETEKWEPYRDWAGGLDRNHSVVTFNYDRIPDQLAECEGSKLIVMSPENGAFKGDLNQGEAEDKACVFKVHGSVDWGRDEEIGFRARKSNGAPWPDAGLIWKKLGDFGIGIPGPAKSDLVTRALRHLWDEAMKRIGEANFILFVGYRFPPSDSLARKCILKAIHDSPISDRKAITILGPNNPDEPRLRHLLDAALGSSGRTLSIPLYAQDYLSLRSMMDFERAAGSSDDPSRK